MIRSAKARREIKFKFTFQYRLVRVHFFIRDIGYFNSNSDRIALNVAVSHLCKTSDVFLQRLLM